MSPVTIPSFVASCPNINKYQLTFSLPFKSTIPLIQQNPIFYKTLNILFLQALRGSLHCYRGTALLHLIKIHPHPTAFNLMSTLKRKAAAEAGGDAKKARQNGNIASFFGAPKPVAAPTAKAPAFSAFDAPAVKFNKEKWVASLTPEQRDLLQLEIDTLDVSWLTHLKEDITSPEFLNLKKFLAAETKAGKKWFPPAEDVYSWYESLNVLTF